VAAASGAPSVFDEALGSIQTAARWIVGAAAVIVGALISGLQLKDLGPLLDGPLPPLVTAAVACVAAIAGAGTILIAAAQVLLTQGLTLIDIAKREVAVRVGKGLRGPGQQVSDVDPLLRSLAMRQRELFPPGVDDVLAFQLAYEQITEAAARLRRGVPATADGVTYTPGDAAALQDLEARASDYRERAGRIVDAAQMYLARRAFRRLIWILWAGGALTIAGVVAFVLATAAPVPIPVAAPTQVHVIITAHPPRGALAAAGLPPACAGQALTGAAIGGSWFAPLIVTRPAPSCPAREFTLTKALGLAIPLPEPG
jgi:hypothetical protein